MSAATAERATWMPQCPTWCDRGVRGGHGEQQVGYFVVHYQSCGSDRAAGWSVEVSAVEDDQGVLDEFVIKVETSSDPEFVDPDEAVRLAQALVQSAVLLAAIK